MLKTSVSNKRRRRRRLAGFERRWAYYKIVQLVFKLLLAASLVILTGQLQVWVSVSLYGALAAMSFYATPFVDDWNDVMDSSGRIAGLVTGVGGALLLAVPNSLLLSQSIGVVLSLASAVNFLIMVSSFMIGNKRVQAKVKHLRGSFTWTDTVTNTEHKRAERAIPKWDLDREIKHRVWHTFWEGVLLNKCGEEVAQRLLELQDAASMAGIEHIRSHWRGQQDPQIAAARQGARKHLEGVDVYWPDAAGCRDGVLDSKTKFCKMYIVPYPFHCVLGK